MKQLPFFETQKLYIESIDKEINRADKDGNYNYLVRILGDLYVEWQTLNRLSDYIKATKEDITTILSFYTCKINTIKSMLKDDKYSTF